MEGAARESHRREIAKPQDSAETLGSGDNKYVIVIIQKGVYHLDFELKACGTTIVVNLRSKYEVWVSGC